METTFNIACPYCQERIVISWEREAAAWVCDECDNTFWVRRRSVTLEQSEQITEYYGVRLKISGCCGN